MTYSKFRLIYDESRSKPFWAEPQSLQAQISKISTFVTYYLAAVREYPRQELGPDEVLIFQEPTYRIPGFTREVRTYKNKKQYWGDRGHTTHKKSVIINKNINDYRAAGIYPIPTLKKVDEHDENGVHLEDMETLFETVIFKVWKVYFQNSINYAREFQKCNITLSAEEKTPSGNLEPHYNCEVIDFIASVFAAYDSGIQILDFNRTLRMVSERLAMRDMFGEDRVSFGYIPDMIDNAIDFGELRIYIMAKDDSKLTYNMRLTLNVTEFGHPTKIASPLANTIQGMVNTFRNIHGYKGVIDVGIMFSPLVH